MFSGACGIQLLNFSVDKVSIVRALTVKAKNNKDGGPGPINFVLSST